MFCNGWTERGGLLFYFLLAINSFAVMSNCCTYNFRWLDLTPIEPTTWIKNPLLKFCANNWKGWTYSQATCFNAVTFEQFSNSQATAVSPFVQHLWVTQQSFLRLLQQSLCPTSLCNKSPIYKLLHFKLQHCSLFLDKCAKYFWARGALCVYMGSSLKIQNSLLFVELLWLFEVRGNCL